MSETLNPRPLDILFPNGSVEGVQVFIWDDNTLQPVLWNGSITAIDIPTLINQGEPADDIDAWPTKLILNDTPVGPLNPLPVEVLPLSGNLVSTNYLEHKSIAGSTLYPLIPGIVNQTIRVYRLLITMSRGSCIWALRDDNTTFLKIGRMTQWGSLTLDYNSEPWFVCGQGLSFYFEAGYVAISIGTDFTATVWYTQS